VSINDHYPRPAGPDGSIQTEADWGCIPTFIRKGVSIGSNATILCGVTVGEGAVVGAGSMMTKDVPPYTEVVGNPAKLLREVGRLNREFRRRTAVIGIFPHEESCLRLASPVLMEMDDEWQVGRVYLNFQEQGETTSSS
jgi:hypothetical protein